MKRLMTTVVVLTSLASVAFAQDADILKVIPESSLVAVATKSASGAEKHLGELVAKFDVKLPPGSLFNVVLAMFDVGGEDPLELARAATVDLDGPMALVLVVPAHHIPGKPVGVVVKPADYKRMLKELVRLADAAAVEVTPDGTDVINGEDGVVFAARLGDFAVVAEAEYVVKTFKAAGNRTLAVAPVGDLRKTLLENDFAVYVNVNDLVIAFDPQIAMFRRMMSEAARIAPQPGMPLDPQKRQQAMDAQVDVMLKVASETESLCVGLNAGPGGAGLVTTCQAVPGSTLANIFLHMKPSPEKLIQLLDGPGVFALEMAVDPELLLAAQPLVDRFLLKSGQVADQAGLAEHKAKVAKEYLRRTGRAAMAWTDAPGEPGILHFVYVEEKRPGAPKRDVARDLADIPGLKDTVGPLDVELDVKENVETYRGVAIDRVEATFTVKPEGAGEMEAMGGPDMSGIIKMLFGRTVVVYNAELVDKSLGTVGYAKSDALKTVIDRVLDGRKGGLAGSPAFADAVKGLPAARSGLFTMSVAEMYRLVLPPIFKLQMPGMNLPEFEKIRFEHPSAAGASYGPSPGGMVVHVNVPVQEMLNVRTVFQAIFKAFERRMEGGVDEDAAGN